VWAAVLLGVPVAVPLGAEGGGAVVVVASIVGHAVRDSEPTVPLRTGDVLDSEDVVRVAPGSLLQVRQGPVTAVVVGDATAADAVHLGRVLCTGSRVGSWQLDEHLGGWKHADWRGLLAQLPESAGVGVGIALAAGDLARELHLVPDPGGAPSPSSGARRLVERASSWRLVCSETWQRRCCRYSLRTPSPPRKR
jgi:hypothetical protein